MREVGQYRIEELIGGGRTGEVHRAYDTDRQWMVALKLLSEEAGQDPDFRRRFADECRAVAALRDPHVVPINGFGEIDGRLFVDMRLIKGVSLAALLATTGPLPPERAVGLVGQVAAALDAAHAVGLVHRDVKPSNILVTPDDVVYVVDFGLSRTGGDLRAQMTPGAGVGTMDYAAPEQFTNGPVDARTDVYSLACVLFECLTGVQPFPSGDLAAVTYTHVYVQPPLATEVNPSVAPGLGAVVARGMATAPDMRFAGAGELVAAARAEIGASDPQPEPAIVAGHVPPGGVGPTQQATVPPQFAPAPGPPPGVPGPPPGVPGPPPGVPGPPFGGVPPVGHYPPGPPAWPAAPGEPAGRRRTGPKVLIWLLAVLLVVGAAAVVVGLLLTRVTTGTPGPAQAAPAAPDPQAPAGPVGNSIAVPTVGDTVPVGPTPGYMEIAPDGSFAYIANRAAGVLTVFDPVRNEVTGTIPVPDGGPQFIAFAPDGGRAYVSIFDNALSVNVVGVLDTATRTFVATVPVGIRPFALDVTPDGRSVYVPNHDSGSITVIDTATNTVRTTIQVAPNPHWVDVADDGATLYSANHDSNLISAIDLATDTVLATVPVGTSPHSILAHPTNGLVYNVNYDDSTMSVTDRATNTVVATVPTGSHPQDISLSADGKHGYLATVDDNAIQVFDTTTFEITATIPVGRSPTSIAVAPGGRQAYVTNLADGSVTVLDIAGTA
jgi:serine/threonine-protein kinase